MEAVMTMEHSFSFPLMVGEVEVGLIEGVVVLEPDPSDRDDWSIRDIVLDGSIENPARESDPSAPLFAMVDVSLPETHWLYQRIRLHVLSRKIREEIDYEWDRRERRAA
jgi:hypothetical protein